MPSRAVRFLLLPVAFWLVAAALQGHGHAFRTEFGTYHDEPAHYVTGLLVRDYLAAPGGSPMAFAEDYYVHYPKVAFGHFPPFFYAVQAAWTLPFGAGRASVMLLLAMLAAVLAWLTCGIVAREHGTAAGVVAGVLLLALPLVQDLSRVVMADLLQAVLSVGAALAMGRYAEHPSWRSSAAFGLLAGLAMLTKGTGAALALVPPLVVLLTRRFGLLARPSFWLAAVIAGAMAAPWYLLAPGAMHQSAVPLGFVVAGPEWSPRIRTDWMALSGPWLLPLAAVGCAVRVVVPLVRGRSVGGVWAAATALLVATIGFRAMSPVMVDARHALPAVPAVVMLAATGAAWILGRWPRAAWSGRVVGAAALIVAVALAVRMPPKTSRGMSDVAAALLADGDLADAAVLVSSDALGEGLLIAEVAMREHRPGHVVLRSSKVLFTTGWMGEGYTPVYDTPEQVAEFLERVPVGALVLDESVREQAHVRLLREVLRMHADRWEPLGSWSNPDGRITAWKLRGPGGPPGPVDMELVRRLAGRSTDG